MEGQTVTAGNKTFEIINLIAKGKGGYTYLAKSGGVDVVVKQIHYEPCEYFRFEDDKLSSELRDYKTLSSLRIPMPRLLCYNQEKQFLVKEYIPGDTLAKIVGDKRLNDSHITQIFRMCQRLYPAHLNIDYFPANFVEHQGVLYYVDYECSHYSEEWNFENWGIWFLANQNGMESFLQSGDHSFLLVDGKPVQKGLEGVITRWLRLKPE